MADRNVQTVGDVPRKLKDMGDGTFAEVIATAVAAAEYEAVAVSQTDQVLGATGAAGDYLDHVVLFVATAAQAAVTIKDGTTVIASFPTSPGGGIGVYDIAIRARSASGAWKITTGSGVTALAVGDFT